MMLTIEAILRPHQSSWIEIQIGGMIAKSAFALKPFLLQSVQP